MNPPPAWATPQVTSFRTQISLLTVLLDSAPIMSFLRKMRSLCCFGVSLGRGGVSYHRMSVCTHGVSATVLAREGVIVLIEYYVNPSALPNDASLADTQHHQC